jgi:serine/threonine protein kinase
MRLERADRTAVWALLQSDRDMPVFGLKELKVISQLGLGSSGVVNKVQHKSTGEVYALKVMAPSRPGRVFLQTCAASPPPHFGIRDEAERSWVALPIEPPPDEALQTYETALGEGLSSAGGDYDKKQMIKMDMQENVRKNILQELRTLHNAKCASIVQCFGSFYDGCGHTHKPRAVRSCESIYTPTTGTNPLLTTRPFRDPCVSPALLEAWEYGFVSTRGARSSVV